MINYLTGMIGIILVSIAGTVSQIHDYSLTCSSCLLAKAVLQVEIDIVGASMSVLYTGHFNCILYIDQVYIVCLLVL